MSNLTSLEKARLAHRPKLPDILEKITSLKLVKKESSAVSSQDLADLFPNTIGQPKLEFAEANNKRHDAVNVGVVFSGGQAAGGHNVVTGLFDALKKLNPESQLVGFLNGPSGIVKNQHIKLTGKLLDTYRNLGGFDLLGAGRTKIETPEQFEGAVNTVQALQLDGLVIIGGDDSNTNAALLAEYFKARKIGTRVVGVPKTIDGDLKNADIEISFGFDTATKTYSASISNILRDSLSAKKYYFFIKLMGRSASHIALECALQTHPNVTLIGEEISAKKFTLKDLVAQICDVICVRSEKGKDYGVVLIPEGIIEFIPEFQSMIMELNRINIASEVTLKERRTHYAARLTPESKACFDAIPHAIQKQLLLDRDPHGNVQVSKIETERLLIEAVKDELSKRKTTGHYRGKFSAQPLFFGYEGRSCLPSNFDCNYCYALGHAAALLINMGATGYMGCIQNLTERVEDWRVMGLPLTGMIHLEERKGKRVPVIKKALVDLEGRPFAAFRKGREQWGSDDAYRYPGPIQFEGPAELTDGITQTLQLERQSV